MRIFALILVFTLSGIAYAHGPKGHKNLKVLAEMDHKQFDAGMKAFSSGLGVKCVACHVKGVFEKDDVPAKLAAREFMSATIGEKDQAKKSEALAKLLGVLKREKAEDEAKVWQTIDAWKKK